MQNLNVTGLLWNPTQMWNADIDYPYARASETVSGASALAVQKPIRKGCGDGFSGVLWFCLGFAPKSDWREICEPSLSLKNRSDRSLPIPDINESARNLEKSNIGNVGYRCQKMCWSGFWPTFEMTRNVQFGCSINIYPAGSLVSNVKCCRESEMLNAVADQG